MKAKPRIIVTYIARIPASEHWRKASRKAWFEISHGSDQRRSGFRWHLKTLSRRVKHAGLDEKAAHVRRSFRTRIWRASNDD
jgi:hypothetical protein